MGGGLPDPTMLGQPTVAGPGYFPDPNAVPLLRNMAQGASAQPQQFGPLMMVLSRIFGDGNTAAAGMQGLIPPIMPSAPQTRGTAPHSPWPSGQTFGSLWRPRPNASMLG